MINVCYIKNLEKYEKGYFYCGKVLYWEVLEAFQAETISFCKKIRFLGITKKIEKANYNIFHEGLIRI